MFRFLMKLAVSADCANGIVSLMLNTMVRGQDHVAKALLDLETRKKKTAEGYTQRTSQVASIRITACLKTSGASNFTTETPAHEVSSLEASNICFQ